MNVFLDLTLGVGLALAVGLRPFPPPLLAGVLATGDLGVDFDRAGYPFLEAVPFLAAMGAAFAVAIVLDQRLGSERLESGPLGWTLTGVSLALGAVLFAGALSQHTDLGWLGAPAGVACAALARSVARRVLAGSRARLADAAARRALPLYFEAAALGLAGLVVLAPPLSLLALAFLARLQTGSRRQRDERFAGLRVLR
ncbi:MAG TPA: hypothetical protein VGY97_05780 [Solirubrobacteraceae bacterium]|nr:hypothetical protein [Solirubrobacteraceae bacterium]